MFDGLVLLPVGVTLWLLIVAAGAYHGLSPGMGWPLAVSNGLFKRSETAVFTALAPLALGHFLAMAAVLLPFTMLVAYLDWGRPVRIAAALIIVAFGLWRLVDRRHPTFLRRVQPTQLTLWSFLMATAHGAGLMLVPMVLGLCTPSIASGRSASERAMTTLMGSSLGVAILVALVHTLAMLVAGGMVAWGVYRWFGVRAIGATWFNLDRVWALSLIVSGAVGGAFAIANA